MNAAQACYKNEYNEKMNFISSEALKEISAMHACRAPEQINLFTQLFDWAAKRGEMLAFLINLSIDANQLFYSNNLAQLREIVSRTEDEILANPLAGLVPKENRIRLRNANMELAKAICQLEIASSEEIDKAFEGRKTYA